MKTNPSAPAQGAATTLHIISDTHTPQLSAVRRARMVDDVRYGNVPTKITARVNCGDFSNDNGTAFPAVANTTADDNDSVAFHNSLLQSDGTVPNWYTLVGNHDMWNSYTGGSGRVASTAMTAYGYPAGTAPTSGAFANIGNKSGVNYTVDFPSFLGVFMNPASLTTGTSRMQVSSGDLTWLDGVLAASAKDCVIFFHAPLKNTVLDSITSTRPSDTYDSNIVDFYAYGPTSASDDAEIRTILGNRSKARMWISGHTHNHPYYANLVGTTTVGARSITYASTPGAYFTAPAVDGRDQVWGFYLSVSYSGVWELRLRNHSSRTWDVINRNTTPVQVWTVA
jgi:hypothetical protein